MNTFQTVEQMQAEIERLRELVEEAYTEGYNDRSDREMFPDRDWYTSIARRYLQPEEIIIV